MKQVWGLGPNLGPEQDQGLELELGLELSLELELNLELVEVQMEMEAGQEAWVRWSRVFSVEGILDDGPGTMQRGWCQARFRLC